MSVGIVPPLAGSVATSADLPPSDGGSRRRPSVKWQLLGLAVVWIVLYKLLDGKWPLESGVPENAQAWLQDFSSSIGNGRLTNPLFIYVLNPITEALQAAYDGGVWITQQLGWTGMTGLATAIALVLAGWRMALLTFLGFLSFGIVGLWDESMETLVLVAISVVLSVIIGIPLGVWAGLSPRFERFLIPVLDTLQIMPSLAYLPFITLFFLIGPPSGIVATLIYAVPPVIRLTAVGIREVAPESVEASRSLGATARQVLFGVQLPMSRRTRVVGINQTVMAALSMVTIAALVAAPGLGQAVVNARCSCPRAPDRRATARRPRRPAGGAGRRPAAAARRSRSRRTHGPATTPTSPSSTTSCAPTSAARPRSRRSTSRSRGRASRPARSTSSSRTGVTTTW